MSESKHERLVERRRRLTEPETEDLVRVATCERGYPFAAPQRGTVEMSAEDREQLFLEIHEREGISTTAAPLKAHDPQDAGSKAHSSTRR